MNRVFSLSPRYPLPPFPSLLAFLPVPTLHATAGARSGTSRLGCLSTCFLNHKSAKIASHSMDFLRLVDSRIFPFLPPTSPSPLHISQNSCFSCALHGPKHTIGGINRGSSLRAVRCTYSSCFDFKRVALDALCGACRQAGRRARKPPQNRGPEISASIFHPPDAPPSAPGQTRAQITSKHAYLTHSAQQSAPTPQSAPVQAAAKEHRTVCFSRCPPPLLHNGVRFLQSNCYLKLTFISRPPTMAVSCVGGAISYSRGEAKGRARLLLLPLHLLCGHSTRPNFTPPSLLLLLLLFSAHTKPESNRTNHNQYATAIQ